MSCNICEDAYGFTFCNCSFSMCKTCAKKHLEAKKKDECPQCKKSLKTKHFFSGKICDKGNLQNISLNRIFVHKDDDDPDILCNKHGLGSRQRINEDQKVAFSDFMLCDSRKSNYVKMEPANLDVFNQSVGPYILIIPGTTANHGCIDWPLGSYGYDHKDILEENGSESNYAFEDDEDDEDETVPHPFENIVDISETVLKRNTESIKECDVFTLKVNDDNDCFYSFVEWGQAERSNKILILDINPKNQILKEYYLLAKESLISLKKHSFTKKEGIIQNHPELLFGSYKSYEKFMNHIMDLKKGVYSSYP